MEAKKEHEENGWNIPDENLDSYCIGRLSVITSDLTDSNKYARERAKKRIRELVKIGKEAEAEKLTPDNDNELPGMWTKSDFTGGQCG
jgi:hypothetical protein